jgi:hypothetical protein
MAQSLYGEGIKGIGDGFSRVSCERTLDKIINAGVTTSSWAASDSMRNPLVLEKLKWSGWRDSNPPAFLCN